MQERYTEIERENRILLEKMTNILQSTKGVTGISHTQNPSTSILPPINVQNSHISTVVGKRSLNREYRKKELMKITQENQRILQRLQEKQPYYNVTRWAKEDQARKAILHNICEYPYQLQASQTQSSEEHPSSQPTDFQITNKKSRTSYANRPFA